MPARVCLWCAALRAPAGGVAASRQARDPARHRARPPAASGLKTIRRNDVKPAARPVDFNPLRIRLPVPGWVSLLHRVSGVLLFAALPLGAVALSVSLADEIGFQRVAACLAHPLGRLVLLGWAWAFTHHFFAGLRHLALDLHWGVALADARRSSVAVLAASGLITLAAAWGLFG